MSSNTFLVDAASRHSVFLQKYSAGIEKSMADAVSEALSGVVSDLSTVTGSQRSLQLTVISNYRAKLTTAEAQLYDELIELAKSEEDFSFELFEEAINASISEVSDDLITSAVDSTRLNIIEGQRITIPDMLSQFTEVKSRQINNLLQEGFIQGETQDQIISKVRQIEPLQRRQAASLVRTGTNAVSTIARTASIEANMDVLDGIEIVATLDDKTSHLCMGVDGVVLKISTQSRVNGYRITSGKFGEMNIFVKAGMPYTDLLVRKPLSPYHFSCRTTIVPKVNIKYNLLSKVDATRPSIGGKGVEQVNAQTNYGGWLRKQPASFQDKALGPARAKLFRQGGLSVSKFVNYDGETYTLDELRALNPIAFEKANL